MPKFGPASESRRKTLHPTLQKILLLAIVCSPRDFGIASAWRGEEEQDRLLSEGKSNAAWLESPHNIVDIHGNPWAMGFDIYYWDGKRAIWGGEVLERTSVWLQGFFAAHGVDITLGLYFRGGVFKKRNDPGHLEMSQWRDFAKGGD